MLQADWTRPCDRTACLRHACGEDDHCAERESFSPPKQSGDFLDARELTPPKSASNHSLAVGKRSALPVHSLWGGRDGEFTWRRIQTSTAPRAENLPANWPRQISDATLNRKPCPGCSQSPHSPTSCYRGAEAIRHSSRGLHGARRAKNSREKHRF